MRLHTAHAKKFEFSFSYGSRFLGTRFLLSTGRLFSLPKRKIDRPLGKNGHGQFHLLLASFENLLVAKMKQRPRLLIQLDDLLGNDIHLVDEVHNFRIVYFSVSKKQQLIVTAAPATNPSNLDLNFLATMGRRC